MRSTAGGGHSPAVRRARAARASTGCSPATFDAIPGSGSGKRDVSEPSAVRFCPLM